ncbi:alpha/beta fold hydrolase [Nonomuraea roseoviolacea]|uniref:Pimeloyl-ACP methyl ester carboxylesterase n=1 Tax=Nonomuraea roseoviolacea subsp. carminata TaxID=160689 RepID=A0ABT1JU77_9ACTN|nr:alpha/beta hydrolase [Nonomuraea roseoviolacea]MCP2345145.1 pimeloyl-ACP methyl ester carboxylesterase [Nonomuraea roseoviolacea subsp. carminata]
MGEAPSDAELARSLDGGFVSAHADVNGTRLHYVSGGHGAPLILLGGWPQTWWEFHKIMPPLAERHRVIAVDLRGMGGSGKPSHGYDKKTMAADILGLVRHLGHDRVDIAGHDIGGMVAHAFAANHPAHTRRIALLDIAHPDERFYTYSLLPRPGRQQVDGDIHAGPGRFLWWFAFNQVPGLPERLLAGRSRDLVDWMIDYLVEDPGSISDHDRDVYAHAYATPDAIRAGNAWYRAFGQDIADEKTYGRVTAPLLGLGGGEGGHMLLQAVLPDKGTDVQVALVPGSGHYIPEEQPGIVVEHLTRFFA